MIKKLTFITLALAMLAVPVLAADQNGNGTDDSAEFPIPLAPSREDSDIAVVDTGGSNVSYYISRLAALGYTVTPIPIDSGLETLLNYRLVILPESHGDVPNYSNFDSRKDDYLSFVETGGGLWVSQPNPWQHPGQTAEITWVPYSLVLYNQYSSSDCPVLVSDTTHCITAGYEDNNFSFPGDVVVSMGPEWLTLVVGQATGHPGAIFAEYGSGKVLAEFGNPNPTALCGMDDVALRQYVECTIGGGPVSTDAVTLDDLKAMFK